MKTIEWKQIDKKKNTFYTHETKFMLKLQLHMIDCTYMNYRNSLNKGKTLNCQNLLAILLCGIPRVFT